MKVVPHAELMSEAGALATKLRAIPACRALSEGRRRSQTQDIHEMGSWISQTLGVLFQTEDHREGR